MSSDTKLMKDEEGESVDNTKYKGMIGTTHLRLWYPKGSDIETILYSDSDHAGDYVDRKSTSGICTFMGCCLTSWFSNKQTVLAISTTESEYVSAEKACQQALWMKQALIDYDIRLDDIPIISGLRTASAAAKPCQGDSSRIVPDTQAVYVEQYLQEFPTVDGKRGDGVTGIKRRYRDLSSDGIRKLTTALGPDGNPLEISGDDAWEAKKMDNPPNIILNKKLENLKASRRKIYPQSTPQVIPSFEENTPPVTYSDEVEETIGLPIEVEPLDETPLEDLGLNTCDHGIPLSSREIPSFDEPEPQPQPFPSFPSLEVDLGEKRDPEPPIKPPSSYSFRMNEVDHLTIHRLHLMWLLSTLRIRIAIITHALMFLRNILDLNQVY
ncbi:hypothetical protein Tco_0857506 [Tanacetum coccineum]|uniref:Copia protein n=1 Tax=Tanacetum coccineum TaxID=301880 RepID=A0ABQ5BC45_9ASTR